MLHEIFRDNVRILIGIDRHWALIGQVLGNIRSAVYAEPDCCEQEDEDD